MNNIFFENSVAAAEEEIETYREGLRILRGLLKNYDNRNVDDAGSLHCLIDVCYDMCGDMLCGESFLFIPEEMDDYDRKTTNKMEIKKLKEENEKLKEIIKILYRNGKM